MTGNKWIFGYGSLMWFPNFEYKSKELCYIPGWKRRFWQGSTDHRGVPGSPGRVLSIVQETSFEDHPHEIRFKTDSKCWGIVFEVEEEKYDEIISYLDHREKCGYTRTTATVYHRDDSILAENVVIYIPTPDNEEFLGPATLEQTAIHIINSVGPSGKNVDYLLSCAKCFRNLNIEDDYIYALEAEVLKHLKIALN